MDTIDKIKYRIKQNEGCKLVVYKDTREKLTVGYGHKVTDSDNLKLGDTIAQSLADNLFEHDFFWIVSQVKQLVPGFDHQPEGIQITLCDMAYNNGIEGLKGYKKFLSFINMGQRQKAADEIVDSANYRSEDLHGRYIELEKMVRNA